MEEDNDTNRNNKDHGNDEGNIVQDFLAPALAKMGTAGIAKDLVTDALAKLCYDDDK